MKEIAAIAFVFLIVALFMGGVVVRYEIDGVPHRLFLEFDVPTKTD